MYYATTTEVKSVLSDNSSASVILPGVSGAKLGYDKQKERLVYLDSSGNLKSAKRDGSDIQTIAIRVNIPGEFAVNYVNREMYYIEELFKGVNSINLDTGKHTINIANGFIASASVNIGVDPQNQ